MGQVDPMGLEAIARFEEVAEQARREGKRVKAILLCSPNNPLGLFVFSIMSRSWCSIANPSGARSLLSEGRLKGLHETLSQAQHTLNLG